MMRWLSKLLRDLRYGATPDAYLKPRPRLEHAPAAGHQLHAEPAAPYGATTLEELHRACRLGAAAGASLEHYARMRAELRQLTEDALTSDRALFQQHRAELNDFDRESEALLAEIEGETRRWEAQLHLARTSTPVELPAGNGVAGRSRHHVPSGVATVATPSVAELEAGLQSARQRGEALTESRLKRREAIRCGFEAAARSYLRSGALFLSLFHEIEADLRHLSAQGELAAAELRAAAEKSPPAPGEQGRGKAAA